MRSHPERRSSPRRTRNIRRGTLRWTLQRSVCCRCSSGTTFGLTSSRFGGETRNFTSFSAPLAEIVQARIWAGLHLRTADVQSVTLGDNIVNYMVENYFQPVGNH
jgi:hypothetical protein